MLAYRRENTEIVKSGSQQGLWAVEVMQKDPKTKRQGLTPYLLGLFALL